ncbi:MAG: hypothetical protein ABSH41_29790 [Syntrophobacteraceae bacterium]|jgi:FMN phosphatase YigB (HAD superfamily)
MKTIIWDVDDVLNDLMRSWFEEYATLVGADSHITYNQLTSNPPHELLGISRMEYLASLDAFRLSEMAGTMKPVHEIFEWFCRYGESCHNVALTAAPLCASPVCAEWVMRNFGLWIRSFNVIPSPRPGIEAAQYHGAKSDFLGWWGKADILVDDSEENIAGAVSLGIQAVLFPRPWNRSVLTIKETLEIITQMALEAV